MPVDIILLGMVGAAGYAALGETEVSNPSNFEHPFNDATNIWPLADWVSSSGHVYHPVVSSPFGTPRSDAEDARRHQAWIDGGKKGPEPALVRKHAGCDIMYARRTLADMTDRCPPNGPLGSKWHFIPEPFSTGQKKTPVFAIADAVVWNSSDSARGWNTVLDHGKPWASYYQHMVDSTLPPISGGKGGRRVRQGDIIGYVSGNPVQRPALKHLHFEIWKHGGSEAAIDPEPLLIRWRTHNRP
jgi:hypothetical protein